MGQARIKGDSRGRWWGFILGDWEGGAIEIYIKLEGDAAGER